MVVNHFPIRGIFFGIGILIAEMFLKKDSLKNTAYILFVIASIFVNKSRDFWGWNSSYSNWGRQRCFAPLNENTAVKKEYNKNQK